MMTDIPGSQVLSATEDFAEDGKPAEMRAPMVQTPVIEKLRGDGPWLQVGSPKGYEWNRVHLPVKGLPAELAGLRVVQMTDLHLRSGWATAFDDLIATLRADPPDLILFTGDLVDHHFDPRPAFATAKRLVSQMVSRHGKFAILGNHDGDLLGPMLEAWGLKLIDGRVKTLAINGAIVELIGVPGVHRYDVDHGFLGTVPHRTPTSRSSTLRIAMSHYPDAIRKLGGLHADAVLSGHTHGGQICLPNGKPLITHDRLPKKYASGVHWLNGTWLVIGRGFGFSGYIVRTWCPAEVVEVVFENVPESDSQG